MSVQGTQGSKALEEARDKSPGKGEPLNSLHQNLSHLIGDSWREDCVDPSGPQTREEEKQPVDAKCEWWRRP
eukprot:9601855-Prorocentrum_lima.AAC.1